MSQLLPALLLILRLISPVCAVEPYEAFCTSQEDFKTDTVAGYECNGQNAKACTDAGGTYFEDRICIYIDLTTPDKCEKINGFTYVPVTCGGLGAYLSVPDNAARDLDCSGWYTLLIIPTYQSTCCGGAGNQKRICNATLIICILYSVMAIIDLALGIYGFRLLKADWALGRKTEKDSVLRMAVITATISCIFLMVESIGIVTQYSGILKDVEALDRVSIGSTILGVIGYFLILFSLIHIAVLTIQAMALAEAGIVATRERWLILVWKYGALTVFLSVCAVGVLSVVTSNNNNFHRNIFATCFVTSVFFGFLFGYLSYKFRTLAANQTSTNTEQQGIPNRCREIHRFTMIISICYFLLAIAVALMVVMSKRTDIVFYLGWAFLMLSALVVYIIVRDLSLLTNRNDHNHMHEVALMTPLLEPTTSPKNCNDHTVAPKVIPDIRTILKPPTSSKPSTHVPEVTGIAITNKDQHYVGMAPHAPRPSWLPTTGTGQANVRPNCWSISLENWVRFVHECMATATWSSLAETKGGKNINMYDINVHFIKPWTSGTGCSIACLMEDNQGPVDLMVSHSWAGSVMESLNSIKTITTMYLVPKETQIFFCTMCMYQADDGAIGGLSITEQLEKRPFQTIIDNEPQRGMFIIHTTISEVYERLWCVHEVDEAIEANVRIYGAFDPASWNAKALKSIVTSFSTETAECQGESDKIMLTDLVNDRGGFDRLDSRVRDVRQQCITDLKAVNLFEQLFSMSISSVSPFRELEA